MHSPPLVYLIYLVLLASCCVGHLFLSIPIKKKEKKKGALKYLILIINCGAYWKLTFIWAISQYCEHCHYLTAISSHALLPDPNFKLRIGYLNFCESQLHS